MGEIPRKVAFPSNPKADNAFWETQNRVLAHQVSFGSTFGNTDTGNNMGCWKATGTTPAGANTEFFVPHNLTRIPIFFFYILDRVGDLYSYYAGMTAWTAATSAGLDGKVYMKCEVASANYHIIIV